MKSTALPLVPAMDLELELTPARPAEIELSDEDLERVVGGLARAWLPPDTEPSAPGMPEL